MENKIPLSVIVTTKNEEKNVGRCLGALKDFAKIIVVDSHSMDRTCAIAREYNAQVVSYRWDGKYPKKRQWCLDTLALSYDWVFWVDADEVVTPALVREIRRIFSSKPDKAGYFVRGRYVWNGEVLDYGLKNNKLCLFDRRKIAFPVVNDLGIEGMGEMEGHYQPVLKAAYAGEQLGQVKAPLLHYAAENKAAWEERHKRYALWEAEMTRREAWPQDPVIWRENVKKTLRTSFLRPYIMFTHSYVLKGGFMDGQAGMDFAKSRMKYCSMIRKAIKKN